MIHNFLSAVGFQNLTNNKELYDLLEWIVKNPEEQAVSADVYGNRFGCFSRSFGKDFGIAVYGDYLGKSEFHIEYYYPYLTGSTEAVYDEIEIERLSAKDEFSGICDEFHLGVTMIFQVTNGVEVMKVYRKDGNFYSAKNVRFSGLAISGKVLLPVLKTAKRIAARQEKSEKRMNLMQQAKEGSQTAMDHLTLSEMDTYSRLHHRVVHNREDILSIVESSFIPYGVESSQYIIIGEIAACRKEQNRSSFENVWILTLNCNGVMIDIAVNENVLFGEPAVGRRFRGRILLQGKVCFNEAK